MIIVRFRQFVIIKGLLGIYNWSDCPPLSRLRYECDLRSYAARYVPSIFAHWWRGLHFCLPSFVGKNFKNVSGDSMHNLFVGCVHPKIHDRVDFRQCRCLGKIDTWILVVHVCFWSYSQANNIAIIVNLVIIVLQFAWTSS